MLVSLLSDGLLLALALAFAIAQANAEPCAVLRKVGRLAQTGKVLARVNVERAAKALRNDGVIVACTAREHVESAIAQTERALGFYGDVRENEHYRRPPLMLYGGRLDDDFASEKLGTFRAFFDWRIADVCDHVRRRRH